MKIARTIATVVVSLLILLACASGPERVPETKDSSYLDRVQVQQSNGVTVRTGVPSARETRDLFGTNLYKRGVQPVWLEITNDTGFFVSFLPVGLDPSYYTPIEIANLDKRLANNSSKRDQETEARLFRAGMGVHIAPGVTRKGFIFSRLDEGTKAFNVDVAGKDFFQSFTFFVPVPGLHIDHYDVDWEKLYDPEEQLDLDKDKLIDWLEAQTCCTANKAATNSGDPVNLVVIGHPRDVFTAFLRAGWDETETITSGSLWKTMKSFIGGGEYRYSPVSGLYVFDRAQDVAFQKARNTIHERNHLRLWLAPVTLDGTSVFLGQISRDIGVRFTRKTITTHKIDPDVDETREYLLENLAYSQSLEKFAYVGGVGKVSINEPRGNLTGDPWFSDGFRLVLWVSQRPVGLHSVKPERWQQRTD